MRPFDVSFCSEVIMACVILHNFLTSKSDDNVLIEEAVDPPQLGAAVANPDAVPELREENTNDTDLGKLKRAHLFMEWSRKHARRV